jgi:hypothetical protein
MSHSKIAKVVFASAVAMTVMALSPTIASASEGARSVGKGIKCSQRMVLQADGTYRVQQVCYKSI